MNSITYPIHYAATFIQNNFCIQMIISKTLLIDGLALLKVWAIGFFGFHISGMIHILLAMALIALLVSFLSRKIFIWLTMPGSQKQ